MGITEWHLALKHRLTIVTATFVAGLAFVPALAGAEPAVVTIMTGKRASYATFPFRGSGYNNVP